MLIEMILNIKKKSEEHKKLNKIDELFVAANYLGKVF